MSFIIFDLEFNQDSSSLQNFDRTGSYCPFEIIQIGAVKLDLDLKTIDTFNRYVKPTFYSRINPFVTELTGITIEQLLSAEPFPKVYEAFIKFIKDRDSIFCTWGMSDITELFRNVTDHKLDHKYLPNRVIDLQTYVSKHFNLSKKNMLRLQHAVEKLNIPITYPFHDALQDAYYTAEIFKKVFNPSIKPQLYDPSYRKTRPKPKRSVIDFDKLILQFEKMYARKMTPEEQYMIKLAYKMERTNQFLKEI